MRISRGWWPPNAVCNKVFRNCCFCLVTISIMVWVCRFSLLLSKQIRLSYFFVDAAVVQKYSRTSLRRQRSKNVLKGRFDEHGSILWVSLLECYCSDTALPSRHFYTVGLWKFSFLSKWSATMVWLFFSATRGLLAIDFDHRLHSVGCISLSLEACHAYRATEDYILLWASAHTPFGLFSSPYLQLTTSQTYPRSHK